MAETSVQQEICKACGVDVRPNSMFCYNCGSSVTSGKTNGVGDVSDVWLRENIAEEKANEPTDSKDEIVETDESAPVTSKLDIAEIQEKAEKTTSIQEEARLKSAAAMRRKAKSFQQKQVEVVWEEAEDGSNLGLILAAILMLVFAAALVAIAFYLK